MGDILVWWFKRNNDKHAKPNIQMNKKAADIELDKLVGIIILVVFFLIIFGAFFRPEKGWLNYVADKAEGFVRFIPGRDEIPRSPTLQIPSDLQEVYDNLYETFVKLKETDQKGCWVEYKEIPELNKITITIKASEDGLDMEINNQDQTLSPETILDLKPCIVAGKAETGRDVAEYFLKYYIDGTIALPESRLYRLYKETSEIIIKEDGGFSEEEDIIADEKTYNLNFQYLYKHDSKHICFMPNFGTLRGVCRSSKEGLSDHCFKSIKSWKLNECNIT